MPVTSASEANSNHMPRTLRSYIASHRWVHFVPSGVMLLAITYMSIVKAPMPAPLQDVAFADKWGHMLAYAVWAICMLCDCSRAGMSRTRVYVLSSSLTIAYGGLMEIVQYCFCPLRQGDWLDWLADIVGVCVAMLLYRVVSALLHVKR